MQPSQLSFTNLILEASPLVQIVMLILLSMSIASWAIIYQRTRLLREAKNCSEQFEERFWSGIDLNRLYQECSARRDELSGMEQVFFAGFKEFARLNNLFNKTYVGSVIVGDSNKRYYEAAAGRNWLLGVSAQYSF